MWTDLSSIFSGITHVTDRRTDRILIARPRLHYMQRGKNVLSGKCSCGAPLFRILLILLWLPVINCWMAAQNLKVLVVPYIWFSFVLCDSQVSTAWALYTVGGF